MLKFIAIQIVYDEDIKGMIFVVRQHEVITCIELYANIQLTPTTNFNKYLMNLNIILGFIIHIHLMQPKTLLLQHNHKKFI